MKKTTPPKISYIRDLHKCVTRVTLTYEIQSEIHVCVFTTNEGTLLRSYERRYLRTFVRTFVCTKVTYLLEHLRIRSYLRTYLRSLPS